MAVLADGIVCKGFLIAPRAYKVILFAKE
jgi:hypothetical protein